MDYDYTDEVIAYIDKQLIKKYSRLKSLLSIDELNILEAVNALYREVDSMLREVYLMLAKKIYEDNIRKNLRSLDEEWVDRLLNDYDPVSKYVFSNEEDRKFARLTEAIIASDNKPSEVDAAMRSMAWMSKIFAVRITDEAVLQAMQDDMEEWVRWVAEKDEKTCSVCYKRDGRIYELDLVPAKPHPNCRCRFERV